MDRVAPVRFSSVKGLGVERLQRFQSSVWTVLVPLRKGSLCISVELQRTLRVLVSVSVPKTQFQRLWFCFPVPVLVRFLGHLEITSLRINNENIRAKEET